LQQPPGVSSAIGPSDALGKVNKTFDNPGKTMTTSNRRVEADNDQLPMDLNDLMSAVQKLPAEYREQLEQPLNRVVEYTRRRRRILNLIQEALSQLRMDMKYLMFDLEATRRERDNYKDALEGEL
jgi:hypothetical protein